MSMVLKTFVGFLERIGIAVWPQRRPLVDAARNAGALLPYARSSCGRYGRSAVPGRRIRAAPAASSATA